MRNLSMAAVCGLLFAASTCFAQMYTITDLGSLGGSSGTVAYGMNNWGQVVGASSGTAFAYHGFRTSPSGVISPSSDIGTLGGTESSALAINDLGQVVGWASRSNSPYHAFRTAPNSNLAPDNDLGTFSPYSDSAARGINESGMAVGESSTNGFEYNAFRTSPNAGISAGADNLGTLGGVYSYAFDVNNAGQVVGFSSLATGVLHAFRTSPNARINPATDDLGTLGGFSSDARAINAFGQVIGSASTADGSTHAFRTAPNKSIDPTTDDLGTLGGTSSAASGIDDYGQVVGAATTTGNSAQHAFLYSSGVMHDLNSLVVASAGCELVGAVAINNSGQIAANSNCQGKTHAVLLTPVYRAMVQQPIKANGSSAFMKGRRTVPIKFTLHANDAPTCNLPSADLTLTQATASTLAVVSKAGYSTKTNSGSAFRIDLASCQYIYNLPTSGLGTGTYRVDISVGGIFVGHAVFGLK